MNNQEKISSSKEQLLKDWNCNNECHLQKINHIFECEDNFFEMLSFGENAIIRTNHQLIDWCIKKFADTVPEEIMDGENLFAIESKLREYGYRLEGEHLGFLHFGLETNIQKPKGFEYKLFDKKQIAELYQDTRFENALNYGGRQEVLAIVVYKNGEIVALSTVDNHLQGMWQIGVDVLKEHRGKGLATYITQQIAIESEKRGYLPYYVTWSANIASVRTAMNAGFKPIWIRYYSAEL